MFNIEKKMFRVQKVNQLGPRGTYMYIVTDNRTGVQYLYCTEGRDFISSAPAITVLLDKNGKPLIARKE